MVLVIIILNISLIILLLINVISCLYINLLLSLIILYNTVYHYVYDSNKIKINKYTHVVLWLLNLRSQYEVGFRILVLSVQTFRLVVCTRNVQLLEASQLK